MDGGDELELKFDEFDAEVRFMYGGRPFTIHASCDDGQTLALRESGLVLKKRPGR